MGMTRDEIINANPIDQAIAASGVQLRAAGKELAGRVIQVEIDFPRITEVDGNYKIES